MEKRASPSVDFSSGSWSNAAAEGLPDLANETLGVVAFPLAFPFSFRGVPFLEVALHVPTGRDAQEYFARPDSEKTPHAWLEQILAAPPEILDVMHAADYGALLSAASNLIGKTSP